MDHSKCGKYQNNTVIWSRGMKQHGHLTNAARGCRLNGCRGTRLVVKWANGSVSYPCTKGVDTNAKGEWVIL